LRGEAQDQQDGKRARIPEALVGNSVWADL
jgi:hypothetical protein